MDKKVLDYGALPEEDNALPCPWCGGQDFSYFGDEEETDGKIVYYSWISCNDCYAEGPAARAFTLRGSERLAVALWNVMPREQSVFKKVKALLRAQEEGHAPTVSQHI